MRFIPITIFAVISGLVAVVIAKPITNRKAGGIAIPLARHSSSLNSNKTINLDAVISHGLSVREKIFSGLDNYERNTGRMHPFAVKRSKFELGRRGASLPLTTYQNKLWMAEISIGTPPKTFKVTIDTGSADMWVFQTGCVGKPPISRDRDLWDPRSSESAKYQWMSFELEYADGFIAKGDRYSDNVTIAGFTADPQIFGSATSYTSLRRFEYPADGILGLAFPTISAYGGSPLLASLVRQHKLTNPIFSFKLASSGAEMYVGGANRLLYNGDIVYTPITEPGFWQVSTDDVRVNGDIIFKNVPAMFDTGASNIFGDWERVAELHKRFDFATLNEQGPFGFYYLLCDSFPTVSFTLGGKTFDIPPEALILRRFAEGSSYCYSSIIAQRSPDEFWLIGVTFLQGVYSVFDYSTSQVGFADLA